MGLINNSNSDENPVLVTASVCSLHCTGFLHDLVTVVNFHYLLFSPIKTLFFTLPQSSPDQRLYLNLTRGLTLTLGFSIVTL